MMTNEVSIKCTKLETKQDIVKSSLLTKNYLYHHITPRVLSKVINSDDWSYGEVLSDIVIEGKTKERSRKQVAFVVFVSSPFKNHSHEKILGVRFFAMEPWYDMDTVVKWVKYKMKKLCAERKDFVGTAWLVDEHDIPLQTCLRDNKFKAQNTVKMSANTVALNGSDEIVTKIVFSI